MVHELWYAAAAVCRAGSLLYGPYASDTVLPWVVADAETVTLPEPETLARLLGEPRWSRWWQPALFDTGVGRG